MKKKEILDPIAKELHDIKHVLIGLLLALVAIAICFWFLPIPIQ